MNDLQAFPHCVSMRAIDGIGVLKLMSIGIRSRS
jgi:hypothetical protein